MKDLLKLIPGVTSLCVYGEGKNMFLGSTPPPPHNDGLEDLMSIMSLVSIHISLDSRCSDGRLRKVLTVGLMYKFTFDPFWWRDYFSVSVHGQS